MYGQLTYGILHMVATATTQCPDGGGTCDTGLPQVNATSSSLQSIMQIVIGIAGSIAVVMIVMGGLQFITAQGDPSGVAKARKTLLFAVVGLVVAILAEAIITFVVSKV